MDNTSQSILLTGLGYKSAVEKSEFLKNVTTEQWSEVAQLANRHSVTPLLYHNLKLLNLFLPEDIEVELKEQFLKQAYRNTFLFNELDKILHQLNEKNIPVIVLKGAYLATAVYENIGLRGMSDIDLLVKKEDLLRAEEAVLHLRGEPEQYNRIVLDSSCHFGYKLPDQGLRVEIHWSLVSANMPFLIDVEGLWKRAQPLSSGQNNALALSPEDLLLHLCLHAAKHTFNLQIRMLCDLGEVISNYGDEMNWEILVDRAQLWGACRALYSFLWLSRELLEADIPLNLLNKIKPGDFDDHNLELIINQLFKDTGKRPVKNPSRAAAKLNEQKGLSSKLALIRNRVLLSKEEMAIRYPAPAHSGRIYLYYPLRLIKITKKHGAAIWSLIRGNKASRASAEELNKINSLRDWLTSG